MIVSRKRSVDFIFFIFTSILLLSIHSGAEAQLGGAARRVSPNYYSGLYAISSPFAGRAFSPAVFGTPIVDGIYINVPWKAIEPEAGRYDWSRIDQDVQRAVRDGKKIEIGVIGGGQTPDWLYQQGVTRNEFIINPGSAAGQCHRIQVPSYWEEGYINAYARMIQALSAHLQAIPGAYDAVRIVKMSAITINTGETYIPSATATRVATGCGISNAIDIWRAAGYRPSRIIDAWRRIAEIIGTAFPNKLLAMDIIHRNDFPLIDEQGREVARNSPSYMNVTETLIGIALQRFPGRIAVVWDGLTASLAHPIAISAGSRGAVIGWQTNERGGINVGSLCGPAAPPSEPCTDAGYQAILDHGIDSGGQYIEIWPVDVERFPRAVQEAQQRLKARLR
jgi:hypothetical protein